MKRNALAVLTAVVAMALADSLLAPWAASRMPAGFPAFLTVLLALTPGFVALGVAFVCLSTPSRGRTVVAASLLVARLVAFDYVFVAPKRAELASDYGRAASERPGPGRDYYRAAAAISDASSASGLACAAGALAAALAAGAIARRRRRA